VTPFNLYPLLTGRLPGDIASRLVDHLKNPAKFWTQYPLPTVATNDPHHAPHTMWRGPVWININHFFVDGLLRAGYPNLARELRERTLELVMSQQGIYEYYHPQTGEPPTKTAYNFGWSAACFIDLAIQASEDQLGD
jgi:glycogen debranching enzyme